MVLEYAQLRALLPSSTPPLIWSSHNVESDLLASFAASNKGLKGIAARIDTVRVRAIEKRLAKEAVSATVVSEDDLDRLGPITIPTAVSPNGWPERPALIWSESPTVAFVATMGWAPNSQAAQWFVGQVWPTVQAEVSNAKLLLIGREPKADVRNLASNSVVVTGSVDDVEPYLAQAQVAIAPLLAGGGTRLKILEALMAGRPVVATTIGAEGLTQLEGRGVVLADTPPDFAAAIVALLRDPDAAQQIGLAGREVVLATFGWERVLAPLLDQIRRVAGR